MPTRFHRKPTAALMLLLVYFLAGRLGLSVAFVNTSATAVWAPTGIALAAMLVWGVRVWPVILLGAFLVNLSTSGSLPASLMIAVGNTLEALTGAFLVTHYAHGRHAFDHARDIAKFAFLAALFATMVSATVGVTSLVLNGLAAWRDFGAIWLTWWLGDATGALIVTPLLILWARNRTMRWSRPKVAEALLLILAMAIVSFAVFGDTSPFGQQKYPLEFLTLVPVMWAGFRFSQREVSVLVFVLSGVAIIGTLHGVGPFARNSPNESLLLLQAFVAIVAITGLILAAVVAEKNRTDRSLRAEEQRYRIVAEAASDAVITMTRDGAITYVNAAALRIFGYRTDELIAHDLTMLMPERLQPVHKTSLAQYLATGHRHVSWSGIELQGLHKDGHEIALEVSFGEYHQDGTHVFIGIVRDISERKQIDERIRHLAQHDVLTDLPNRTLCYDRIEQAIVHARRDHDIVALLFLDLDGFKQINDTLGHLIGDEILRATAKRLQQCLREGDTVARIGGDEFVICLPAIDDSGSAIAEKLLESLRAPITIDGIEFLVTGSIGISLYPRDGADVQTLLRAADTAMYQAKGAGRDCYRMVEPRAY